MEATKQTVEMTDEELRQFEAFRKEQAAKRAKEQAKRDREAYKELVDETIEEAIPDLQAVSDCIKTVKNGVLNNFRRVIDMKSEVLKLKKDGQRTDTFTNTAGDKRITVGYYETDGYRDTVEDGIAIVKEYIEGLADNKKTKALVKMVLRLLARNAQGTLKASRIVQLRKIAEESEDERFMEGVQIIEEAYQPAISKQFIRAEVKNDNGGMDSDTIRNDRGMSKQQHALLTQPPLFPKECPVERVEFGGFPCSYCHGNGWFWGVDDYGERIKPGLPRV